MSAVIGLDFIDLSAISDINKTRIQCKEGNLPLVASSHLPFECRQRNNRINKNIQK